MKKNVLRRIIGGLSFTSAFFVFQACYGTPQDFGLDLLIEGEVKSQATGNPIQGIHVSVADGLQYEITDENGKFRLYAEHLDNLKISFIDADSTMNGEFKGTDTILNNASEKVYLNIELEDK